MSEQRSRASATNQASPLATPLPVTARGMRTRAKLVKAARGEFERNGYLDTNIGGIARRARVAYGSFYTYFASKEEIFEEVVKEVRDEGRATSSTEPLVGPDPRSRIARANAAYLRAYQANAAIMAVIEEVATFSPRLGEIRREARHFWVERNRTAIARWQAEGIVRADLDPYYAASALGSMIDRSAYVWFVLKEPFDIDIAIEQLTSLYCAALGIDAPATEVPITRRSRRA